MMENIKHYSTEELVDFLEGRLDPSISHELSQHLESGCESCNASVAFYRRLFSAVKTLHWHAPSANAHRKVVQAFSSTIPSKSKPKFFPALRPALIGFTLLVLISFVFLFNINPKMVYAGHIEAITGQVEMLDPSTGEWQPVTPGQSVPPDASVRTLANAKVTITFPGGEQTILGPASEIHLLALTKVQDTWDITLEQLSGQTDNQTAQNTHAFSVRTAAGIAHGNNAHFTMNMASDGTVTASVLEGELETRTHNQDRSIHTGENTIFVSNDNEVETPSATEIEEEPTDTPTIDPSKTETPTLESTKTPTNNGKPRHTITPTRTPGSLFGNSANADVNCSPGNSNGAGNSENANNSSTACK